MRRNTPPTGGGASARAGSLTWKVVQRGRSRLSLYPEAQHDSKVCRKRAHCAPRAGGGAPTPLPGATTLTVSSCPAAQWPSVEHEKWNVPAALSACRYGDASGPASSDPPSKLHVALGTDHTCGQLKSSESPLHEVLECEGERTHVMHAHVIENQHIANIGCDVRVLHPCSQRVRRQRHQLPGISGAVDAPRPQPTAPPTMMSAASASSGLDSSTATASSAAAAPRRIMSIVRQRGVKLGVPTRRRLRG